MMLYIQLDKCLKLLQYHHKKLSTIQCLVQDQNTINKTLSYKVIIIFITLTPIEPEVELMGFALVPSFVKV